jgi:hypothetical protein
MTKCKTPEQNISKLNPKSVKRKRQGHQALSQICKAGSTVKN